MKIPIKVTVMHHLLLEGGFGSVLVVGVLYVCAAKLKCRTTNYEPC
jgi:hypothetical protein